MRRAAARPMWMFTLKHYHTKHCPTLCPRDTVRVTVRVRVRVVVRVRVRVRVRVSEYSILHSEAHRLGRRSP